MSKFVCLQPCTPFFLSGLFLDGFVSASVVPVNPQKQCRVIDRNRHMHGSHVCTRVPFTLHAVATRQARKRDSETTLCSLCVCVPSLYIYILETESILVCELCLSWRVLHSAVVRGVCLGSRGSISTRHLR